MAVAVERDVRVGHRERAPDSGRGQRRLRRQVLVLYVRGRDGAATLLEAARLVHTAVIELTVVTFAPQETGPPRCAAYTGAYNRAVRAEARAELEEARRLLGGAGAGERAHYGVLVEGRDRPLDEWAPARGFELVLLPGRRLGLRRRRRTIRRLRRAAGVEVRVISPSRLSGR